MTVLWTLAYGTTNATTFERVQGIGITWLAAHKLAKVAATARPDLSIWYVPTADCDVIEEDRGNILTEDDVRVPMAETGSLGHLGLTAIDVRSAEEAAQVEKRADMDADHVRALAEDAQR